MEEERMKDFYDCWGFLVDSKNYLTRDCVTLAINKIIMITLF